MNNDRWDDLLQEARRAKANAHAPYSSFSVGAAVCAENGEVYIGCNVENASYGLTVCAERHALAAGIAAGAKRFVAIAIACDGASRPSPCGACRQVMAEFMPPDADVVLTNDDGLRECFKLGDLLPHPFELKDS